MITERTQKHVLAWLPLMNELENMGIDPVRQMFEKKPLTIESIESSYVALTKCKQKYPEWYKVMSETVKI